MTAQLEYVEPTITFFTRSISTDVYGILEPLYNYFASSSAYFEIRQTGYDAGGGSGSGGFCVGPKNATHPWEFAIQRSSQSSLRAQFDPSGSYTDGPTGTGIAQFAPGASAGSTTTINNNDASRYYSFVKPQFTLIEFPDAFIAFGQYSVGGGGFPCWTFAAGSHFIPFVVTGTLSVDDTLGFWHQVGVNAITKELVDTTSTWWIKMRVSKSGTGFIDWAGGPNATDALYIRNELKTGGDAETLGGSIVPAPIVLEQVTTGNRREMGIFKYVYQMLPATATGTRLQDLNGNVRYMFWGGFTSSGLTTFIIPWNTTSIPIP